MALIGKERKLENEPTEVSLGEVYCGQELVWAHFNGLATLTIARCENRGKLLADGYYIASARTMFNALRHDNNSWLQSHNLTTTRGSCYKYTILTQRHGDVCNFTYT